jgi:hypothetical protein
MLTDEELKAIEERSGRLLEHWQPFDEPPNDEWRDACEDMAALLSEVKRLRAEMRGQTFVSELGWQSVADGAKPGPEDWYVGHPMQRAVDLGIGRRFVPDHRVSAHVPSTARRPDEVPPTSLTDAQLPVRMFHGQLTTSAAADLRSAAALVTHTHTSQTARDTPSTPRGRSDGVEPEQ